MIEPKIFSVGQINRYIKNTLENDFILNSLWVQGEISNFKAHSSGHFYFTLKDKSATMQCIMFRGSAELLPFLPENGMSVIICGYVSVYEKTGQYQLYAELMQPTGIGSLHLAYEQLKQMLDEEGLFDEDYKREICKTPKCIAVITSPTGAAVRDVIQVIKRRNRNVNILVAPVLVQGEYAADDIVSAIQLVNEWGKADTIILGRGGGSIEDLWAFNEEKVARAIFGSETPVISAVGHETDFTISDFVADLRAPTPSAAAELAVDDLVAKINRVLELKERMEIETLERIQLAKERLTELFNRPVLKRPTEGFKIHEVYLENLQKRLDNKMKQKLDFEVNRYVGLKNRLEAGSPLSILHRGYSLIFDEHNNSIHSVDEIEQQDVLTIHLNDGKAKAVVTEKEKDDGGQKT